MYCLLSVTLNLIAQHVGQHYCTLLLKRKEFSETPHLLLTMSFCLTSLNKTSIVLYIYFALYDLDCLFSFHKLYWSWYWRLWEDNNINYLQCKGITWSTWLPFCHSSFLCSFLALNIHSLICPNSLLSFFQGMKTVSLWLQKDKLGSWINHLARENLMMVSGTTVILKKSYHCLRKKKWFWETYKPSAQLVAGKSIVFECCYPLRWRVALLSARIFRSLNCL